MVKLKHFSAILLILVTIFGFSGCSKKNDGEITTLVSSTKTVSLENVKTEEEAKEFINDYIYLNDLDYSIYSDQSGKIDKSIKKSGYFYFAVYETKNGKKEMCDKYFAVKKNSTSIFAVDKSGNMVSVFEDETFGK